MKRIFAVFLIILLIISQFSVSVFSVEYNCATKEMLLLRAGGGGSSGGGSGGSSGGDSGGDSSGMPYHVSGGRGTLLEQIVSYMIFPFVVFFSSIVLFFRLTKNYFRSRKILMKISKSDSAWDYKNLESRVNDSFYAIQEAWSELDMSPASEYMSEKLFERFQTKLSWMKYRNQKNILEKISLLQAFPVAVHDASDNSSDYVWFYIKGRMVDYIIDTDTEEMVEGKTSPTYFSEYWQFVRRENTWVLNEILQKDEADQIDFYN